LNGIRLLPRLCGGICGCSQSRRSSANEKYRPRSTRDRSCTHSATSNALRSAAAKDLRLLLTAQSGETMGGSKTHASLVGHEVGGSLRPGSGGRRSASPFRNVWDRVTLYFIPFGRGQVSFPVPSQLTGACTSPQRARARSAKSIRVAI
jgi:hypothetical protein